jgi:hypothetical protein
MSDLSNQAPSRGRGRPALVHDNRRVQAFMQCFDSTSAINKSMSRLDDALTGATHLRTEGPSKNDSTRPLSKRMLFRAIRQCQTIDTQSVAVALGRKYSPAAIARYTAIARVASKAIDSLLDQNPLWESIATQRRESSEESDLSFDVENPMCESV